MTRKDLALSADKLQNSVLSCILLLKAKQEGTIACISSSLSFWKPCIHQHSALKYDTCMAVEPTHLYYYMAEEKMIEQISRKYYTSS